MKKTFLLIFGVIAFTFFASAQTEQGNFLLGGGFGASFGTLRTEEPVVNDPNKTVITESRSTSITFSPKVGFFIVDGFAIGLNADINNTTYKNKNNDVKTTTSYLALGPFARYYFPMNLFLEAEVGFGNAKGYSGYNESKIFLYSFGAGYAAFLNDNIALEPMVVYSGTRFTRSSNSDYKTIDGGLQIRLGLQIYL